MAKEEWLSSRMGVLLSFEKSRLALGVFLLLAGCSDPPPERVGLQVYSWWDKDVEASAFDQVIVVHTERPGNAGVTVDNRREETAELARRLLAESLLSNAPPTSFQANVGADVLRWALVDVAEPQANVADPVESARYIDDLTRVFEREDLEDKFHPELMEAIHIGDSPVPYAVPINIHRLNTFYYNVARLEKFQNANGGRSFLERDTLCPEDRTTALPARIAIAGDTFALTLLTFENVLPALHGSAFYDQLFRGEVGSSDAEVAEWTGKVRDALECVRYLSRSFTAPMSWSGAVRAVALPDAEDGEDVDFTVMGDWGNGQIEAELREGTVRAVPFPGTEGVFVFTADSFPLPIGIEHRAEALDLLRTIASPEAQYAFSEVKGSIPARNDVELTDPVQSETRRNFDEAHRVLATSGRFPPYFPDLDGRLKAVVEVREDPADPANTARLVDAAIDAALVEFVTAVPLLRRWQARLAAGAAEPIRP